MEIINTLFDEHVNVINHSKQKLSKEIEEICLMIRSSIVQGNKLFLFGNGGSAGDAQHIAAEFTGRFINERMALPAIALTTDTSAITAIGNDYGFDKIFQRQVEALANKGDVLIGISTSGNSQNVINALEAGKLKGCKTIAFTGRDGGKIGNSCDVNLIIPSSTTARIQEAHILVGHIICEYVDSYFK
jgi:D-sedoheptulose 7-phosphate isomerase